MVEDITFPGNNLISTDELIWKSKSSHLKEAPVTNMGQLELEECSKHWNVCYIYCPEYKQNAYNPNYYKKWLNW